MNKIQVHESNKVVKFLLWFYRLTGVAFGGVTFRGTDVVYSPFWNYYGYGASILHTFSVFANFYLVLNSNILKSLVGHHFIYWTLILIHLVASLQLFINIWFIQKHGFNFAKAINQNRIRDRKQKIICVTIWLIHLLGSYLMFVWVLYDQKIKDWVEYCSVISEITFKTPMSWVYLFLTWMLSFTTSQKLRSWRLKLGTDKRADLIHSIRLAYVEARNRMNEMDQKVKYNQILSTLSCMTFVMLQVYILFMSENLSELRYVKLILFCYMIQYLFQLNANCLISGLVHEESDKLLAAIDSIDINTKSNELEFREALLFMSLSREQKFGFTVGGFIPLKKTTLLSMYGFILTYSVILFQTAPIDNNNNNNNNNNTRSSNNTLKG